MRQWLAWGGLAIVVTVALVIGSSSTDGARSLDERAYALKESTACPVCDGQNVLESNAAVANQIRLRIDALVAEGFTDGEIRRVLAETYGPDVNLNPPGSGLAASVWVLPVVLFAAGAGGIGLALHRSRTGESAKSRRPWVAVAGVIAVGAVAGAFLATSFGLRLPGDTSTGAIDRSNRDKVLQAEVLVNGGDFERAGELADEILAEDPDNVEAFGVKADALRGQGEALEALMAIDAGLTIEPNNVDLLTRRGAILVALPDPELIERGAEALDAALAIDPLDVTAIVLRGQAHRQLGELPAAVERYRQALEIGAPGAMVPVLEEAIVEMEAALAS